MRHHAGQENGEVANEFITTNHFLLLKLKRDVIHLPLRKRKTFELNLENWGRIKRPEKNECQAYKQGNLN